MPWCQESTFYQQVQQPHESKIRQDIEHIRPKNRSTTFLNAVKAHEDQYHQGIEHIQLGVRSVSSQMLQAQQIVTQQEKEHIQASALSGLVQVHEDENQGIEYIQTRIRSITSSQVLQTLEYENQQGIEYIQGRMRSTCIKVHHAPDFETPQHIDYIQPKQRSFVIYEVNQQGWKANDTSDTHANQDKCSKAIDYVHEEIDYVLAKGKSTKETTEHESQQDTEDTCLKNILTLFPELRYAPRSLKSYERLNF